LYWDSSQWKYSCPGNLSSPRRWRSSRANSLLTYLSIFYTVGDVGGVFVFHCFTLLCSTHNFPNLLKKITLIQWPIVLINHKCMTTKPKVRSRLIKGTKGWWHASQTFLKTWWIACQEGNDVSFTQNYFSSTGHHLTSNLKKRTL
jgi:hypothetical protein